jgi:pimeloyl-ACP methyl ester carboxylesterase
MSKNPLARRVYLGLELGSVPGPGLGVSAVAPESTAAAAGFEPGDRLIELAGRAVSSAEQLLMIVREIEVGKPISFGIERAGASLLLEARAGSMPLETLTRGSVLLDELATTNGRRRVIRTLPEGDPPFPVVYVLPGADWSSCEFPLDREAPLFQLVSALTFWGFATQRVERSGVGDSEGPSCRELGLESEIEAYQAGLEQLRGWEGCRSEMIFLLGVSLGGAFAPMIADHGVRGIAVIGATARSISRANHDAAERFWRRSGIEESELARRSSRLAALERLVYREKLTPEQAFALEPELRRDLETSYAGDRAFGRSVRFFQELDAVDLEAAWQRVQCPVLALHGEHDWVTTRDDALAIASHARAGCCAELAGVDHEMRERGPDDEPLALAPAVLEAVVGFFNELGS